MIARTTNGLSTSKRSLPLPKKLLFAVVSTLGFFAALEGGLAMYGIRPAHSDHDPLVGFRPGEPLFVHDGDDLVTNELKLSFFNKQGCDSLRRLPNFNPIIQKYSANMGAY